ncbi:MAG: metal-dependent hydrolase [Tepidisphaerales bacterium]
MHLQTHILSGWCLANCLPLSPRQRLCSMLAATLADVDGLGILLGQRYYHQFHHVLGHNLFFAVALSAILAAFSPKRPLSFLLYLALAHVHLVLDYFGSGPLWKIHYLWPWSDYFFRWDNAWEFYSWQNLGTFGLLLVWTVIIAFRAGRTPLEAIMPRLDAQLVAILRKLRPVTTPSNP